MRQVINKLITEEDLYAAVDAAFSQGWRRVKLYFLIGLPTEMDEDTLGIAELARNVVDDRPQSHEGRELHRVGRRLRAQAAHAVPVVRPERRRRAAAQGRAAPRRRSRKSGAQLRGTIPRPRSPRASPAAATAGSAAVIERVWRAGGTFQEWSEHFDLDRWLEAMAAEGLDPDWYVTRHRTRGRGPARGTTSRPGCTATSSGRTGRPRWPSTGCPTAGGRPATTAGCAPTTRSSTSSRRRVAAGGREPGHRSGPRPAAARSRSSSLGTRRRRGVPCGVTTASRSGCGSRSTARCASSRTATWPARSSGRSASRQLPLAFTQGFSPRPKVSFGLALSRRPRERRRVPRPRARASRSTCRRCSTPLAAALPEGIVGHRGRARSPSGPPRCRRRSPRSSTTSTVVDGDGDRRSSQRAAVRSPGRWRHTYAATVDPHAEGPARSSRTSAPASASSQVVDARRDRRTDRRRARPRASSTQPRGARPGEIVAALDGDSARPGSLRTKQWIERDGARQEPLAADCAPRACRRRARHEQRTHRCPTRPCPTEARAGLRRPTARRAKRRHCARTD